MRYLRILIVKFGLEISCFHHIFSKKKRPKKVDLK